ncbi:MAG: hypothetical protein LBQ83_02670 [Candidatus Margulisbacteria bacterium]|jgi:type I restriction enzyme R subunit|nr:hypothetical protein [Candidatus Margulisiibacteriota bacterium]
MLSSIIKPAVDRFNARKEEEQETIRKALNNFIRMYAFVIQVVRLFDKDLQKFYDYAKYLSKFLRLKSISGIKLDDKILLEYYKIEKVFSGQISLLDETGTVTPPQGGTGKKEKQFDPLSVIIEKFNERFGTEFTNVDKVLRETKEKIKKDKCLINTGGNKDRTAFNGLFTSILGN